jgi:predicted aspartyl protease
VLRVWLVLAVVVLSIGNGCARGDAQPNVAETRPDSTTVATYGTDAGENVDLRVDTGSWGVFAFADVFIDGEGPFNFIVDTGASNSVVDWPLVQKLRIKTIGKPLSVTGITCRGAAARIRMSDWRVGGVELPRTQIRAIDMPAEGVDGLLGSDVLSTFGSITLDYDGERLLLRSPS